MVQGGIRVSVVVPTYNERDNVEPLAQRVFAAIDSADSELLFVDDDSPDGTAVAVEKLSGRYPVRCIVRIGQRGLATAVIRGLREARGGLIVVMDADLSHPPEAIPSLVTAMNDPGMQMAIGSRFVAGGRVDLHWPAHRRIISWIGRMLARPLTGVHDMAAGFFCVRRDDVDIERLRPIGYKIALELIVRHGWTRIVELPIAFSDRRAGRTKLTLGEQWRYLRHLARLYAWVIAGRGRVFPGHPDALRHDGGRRSSS
jgi:dolichol-phosphate mannosyltransferase